MTRRTQKIERVVSLAAAEEKSFGEQAGRSQRSLNDQMDRLGELNAFRHSYNNDNPVMSGVSAARWMDYQSFLQRLDRAVYSQQQIIRDCEQSVEVHRKRWMLKRQKLESLERVLEKCQQQDATYESRLEQKQLDDIRLNSSSTMKPSDS